MDRHLRIVYMGTPEFAVSPLKAILEKGYEVAAVVTAPDKPAGRGRNLRQSPVKEYALSHNLPVMQPVNLKDPEFIDKLRSYNASLQIVVAFRMLPEAVWNMPEHGTFNLHASLLPQYRGATPINHVIINGETETGLTTFFLVHEIDTGNIIFREKYPVLPEDNAGSLHDRLSAAGAGLVVRTLQAITEGTYSLSRQEEFYEEGIELKKAPKIYKEDCFIHWDKPTPHVHNLIRGLSPVPGAVARLRSPEGNLYSVKIFRTTYETSDVHLNNGNILTDSKTYLNVKTSDGFIQIKEILLEGKKRLSIEEFLRGFTIDNGWKMA